MPARTHPLAHCLADLLVYLESALDEAGAVLAGLDQDDRDDDDWARVTKACDLRRHLHDARVIAQDLLDDAKAGR